MVQQAEFTLTPRSRGFHLVTDEVLSHLPPSFGQLRECNGLLLLAENSIRTGHSPQLGHIVLNPEGTSEDGVHALPLARSEGILSQQLRVPADDAEGSLEIVGQRGQLQPPLLLHAPLTLQGLGQVLPQVIHG